MKTKLNAHASRFMGLMMAVTLIAFAPFAANAQGKGSGKGGAQQLMKPVTTVQDLGTVKPGDMMVMSCPRCKNVAVTYVEPTFKATEPTEKVKTQHTCPSCGTISTVEGHGKAKQDVLKHVCTNCGSKDAFCCVLKNDGTSTKGMHKEHH
jgi:hypothetical protein